MIGSKRTMPARPDRCLPESKVAALQMQGDSDALARALGALGGHRSPEAPFRTPMSLQRLARLHRPDPADYDRRPAVVSTAPCPSCNTRGDHPQGCAHQRPDPQWLAERQTAAIVEMMREDPFVDDAHLLGTTQQDAWMEHYAVCALTAIRALIGGNAR